MKKSQSKSPSSVKNGNPSIDPVVYIRCHSTPANNDSLTDGERTIQRTTPQLESQPTLYHHFRGGDIISSTPSNNSKPKTYLTTSRKQFKIRHNKPSRSQSRYPSVPESLNYLSVGSNSMTDPNESYDRLQNRLITWDFGKKIKSTPLHRGSFV